MALEKLTKIDGGGISTTSDYRVGVITATKFVGPIEGSITSADATFTGNVSIGGTLTYEDVTNIDSVGLVTAREGIFLPDSKSVKFGNTASSPDFQIFHNTSGEYNEIKSNNGNIRIRNHDTSGAGKSLYIQSEIVQLRSHTNNHTMVSALAGSQVELYFNNEKKLETSAKGIKVGTGVTVETSGQATFTGIVTATSFSGDGSSLSNLPAGAPVGGASTNTVFFENDKLIEVGYEITSTKNAMSAGPISISAGIAVTVPSGCSWTIV